MNSNYSRSACLGFVKQWERDSTREYPGVGKSVIDIDLYMICISVIDIDIDYQQVDNVRFRGYL